MDYSILGSILGFPYFGKLPSSVEGFFGLMALEVWVCVYM